ncbi:MAG: hypothetical protein E7K14_05465 [Bacillota bacterium]|nr:hypothetical protein [Bacillota bacterium]
MENLFLKNSLSGILTGRRIAPDMVMKSSEEGEDINPNREGHIPAWVRPSGDMPAAYSGWEWPRMTRKLAQNLMLSR